MILRTAVVVVGQVLVAADVHAGPPAVEPCG
jgi:hypothetical protein